MLFAGFNICFLPVYCDNSNADLFNKQNTVFISFTMFDQKTAKLLLSSFIFLSAARILVSTRYHNVFTFNK